MYFEIQESTQDIIIFLHGVDLSGLSTPNSGGWFLCNAKHSSQKDITMFIGREPNDKNYTRITPLDLGTKIKITTPRRNLVHKYMNCIHHINIGERAYELIESTGNSKERMPGGSSLIIKCQHSL